MNIIARTGSAIAKYKDQAKKILDSYQIPYGSGKFSEILKAAFTAIKSGNKDLASDIAALVKAKEKTDKAPAAASLSRSRSENLLLELKERILAKIQEARAKKATSADGAPVDDTTVAITDALASTDVDYAVSEAEKGATYTTVYKLVIAVVLIGILIGILYYMKKK